MKNIIIIGGDKIAFYLIPLLKEHRNYKIKVIDIRKDACELIANTYGVEVIHGDATTVEILARANVKEADAVVALTGKDENNLIACQIAKLRFGVDYTISKVNNPRNSYLLKLLGVDKVFSLTEMLAELIDLDLTYSGMSLVYNFPGSSKAIIKVPLSRFSEAVGQSLASYTFPGDSLIVLLTRRNGETVIPNGNLVMQEGDTLLMVCDDQDYETIWKTLVKPEANMEELEE